jgi:hypothetical protein
MTSILESDYNPQDRPYSQDELWDMRDQLYKKFRLGTTKACHAKCRHFYYVKQNGRKEKDILEKNNHDVGNCSVCWKINKSEKDQKHRAINMVDCYSNTFFEEPKFISYRLIDLETLFYSWLYESDDLNNQKNFSKKKYNNTPK